MEVYFIVHGSKAIGMGHMMRSLSLAEAFRERGHNVCFFSKYELGIDKIHKQKFKINDIPIRAVENDMEGLFFRTKEEALCDARYISSKIKGNADVIIVDSYNVNETFFEILKKKTKCLVYIDDLNAFSYPVDILVNGSASAFSIGYEKKQSARLLLGLQYNLLRKEFYNIPVRTVKPKVNDILITTGNSDPCYMTERLLDILSIEDTFKELKIHVIKGSGFAPDALADSAWKDNSAFFLYDKPDNMAEIMSICDLCITAGGSTIYELAACGVPAIAFAYADNQVPQIKAMEKKGLLKYVGFWETLDKENLIGYIQYIQMHYEERRNLIKRLQRLVDAKGALRVVIEVEESNRKIK